MIFMGEVSLSVSIRKLISENLKNRIDKYGVPKYNYFRRLKRGINSVVECHLAKVKVASSNLVSRSTKT